MQNTLNKALKTITLKFSIKTENRGILTEKMLDWCKVKWKSKWGFFEGTKDIPETVKAGRRIRFLYLEYVNNNPIKWRPSIQKNNLTIFTRGIRFLWRTSTCFDIN